MKLLTKHLLYALIVLVPALTACSRRAPSTGEHDDGDAKTEQDDADAATDADGADGEGAGGKVGLGDVNFDRLEVYRRDTDEVGRSCVVTLISRIVGVTAGHCIICKDFPDGTSLEDVVAGCHPHIGNLASADIRIPASYPLKGSADDLMFVIFEEPVFRASEAPKFGFEPVAGQTVKFPAFVLEEYLDYEVGYNTIDAIDHPDESTDVIKISGSHEVVSGEDAVNVEGNAGTPVYDRESDQLLGFLLSGADLGGGQDTNSFFSFSSAGVQAMIERLSKVETLEQWLDQKEDIDALLNDNL